jgi:hypothetical protein
MTVAHHLISEAETVTKCLYCGKDFDLQEWKSNHHIRKHYKEITCECGKTNKVEVKFCGSGHDTWSQIIIKEKNKLNNIEDKVN